MNTLVPSVGGVVALTVTLVRPLQLAKAHSPILVTPLGMLTLVRLLQPMKVLSLILVTPLGIVMLGRLLQ